MVTVPCAVALVSGITAMVPPSGSLSLPRVVPPLGVSSFVVNTSLPAVGGALSMVMLRPHTP